jgi:multidrug transporter EmrE-like cation transporter
MGSVLLLGLSILLGACGQLLMKAGMVHGHMRGEGSFISMALHSPLVWIGVLAYAASAVSWLGVLSKVPLSVAYPCVAAGYVLVMFGAAYWLGESLTPWKVAGTVMVVLGVAATALSYR